MWDCPYDDRLLFIVSLDGGDHRCGTSGTRAQLSYVFDNAFQVGVFARQHWGSDYYNIQFQNADPYFSIGVMWDMGRLDRLNSDIGPEAIEEPKCWLFRDPLAPAGSSR